MVDGGLGKIGAIDDDDRFNRVKEKLMADAHLDRADIEKLFARNLLSRRQFVEALSALGLSASALELLIGVGPERANAQTADVRLSGDAWARYFVLIVLDAFRPDYMTLAPMLSLQRLMQAGTTYDRAWVGQLESETPPGHATITSGSMPRRDQILGFEWRDPKTGNKVLDGWPREVQAGALERDMRQANVNSIPRAVKHADPHATVVALSSEKVYAADAMGAAAADYVLYHRRVPHGLMPAALSHYAPPRDFFDHPHLRAHVPLSHFTNWDYLSTILALAAVERFRPRALLVNLPGADYYGHPYGGPATPSVMREVVLGLDRGIGRIVHAYERAGILDQTLFVVTADHGMVPNVRHIDSTRIMDAVRRAGGNTAFYFGGTAAYIYLSNPQRARAVAAEVARIPNVAAAYFSVAEGGMYHYLLAPGVRIDPALEQAFRSLTLTFAGPRAPDVVAPFRENTISNTVANAHGEHGGLNWGAQSVPLVFSGPGVRGGQVSSYPARLVDVAPTVLRLLGLSMGGMHGTVLADALLSPTAAEVAHQVGFAPTLTARQNPLIAQSIENIGEDARAGLHPPPSLPGRP